jgi:type IV secretory pathway TraG/TraD family ATPase VirD4
MILSSEEIASFFHLPAASTETPKIKWLKSKEAPPPPNLPKGGVLIGESVFRGETKPVYITDDDRRRHVYLVGQTGTGKSTLLGNMFFEDLKQGKGLAVIDPHGDLVQNALGFVPKERLDDLIYFDPGDLERPLGLNMLDYNLNRPEEKTFIVNEMQSIFNKLFPPETMGPMFEQYMRNALLLLMEDMPNEPATLVEVPRVFTDVEYRLRKLQRIHNPVVIDFWEKEAIKAGGEASLANMTPYITSKFNNFISNDYMRPIIGQAKSAFNFRQVMDEGKILLINLSKGRIGDINAGLLGMVFAGKILMAALSRVDIPDVAKRRDFNLYIDEFQNFTTDSISTILSEARKYKLNLTIAHQFIAQLTDKIKDAVFGNVGSMIVFRVGVQDAEFLVKQFEPVFSQNDLLNIDNMNAYAKILINGETSKPFNIKILTTSWNAGNKELAEKLKEYSRVKYGQDRHVVEEEIYRRLRE